MDLDSDTTTDSTRLLLLSEEMSVARRRVKGDRVRVSTVTHNIEKVVDEALMHELVEVERVVIGCPIDTVPPVREEADVTIIPVVEEILFVEKRLFLKEEVRIRRVRIADVHREVVTVREQDVMIERTKPSGTPP